MRRVPLLALSFVIVAHAGSPIWISTKIGPFAIYSEAGPKETRARASELEQFRFSLGELLGRHDLTVHPQLQLFIFHQAPQNAKPLTTRTGAIALRQGDEPLTPENRKTLAHVLLEQNIGRMSEKWERGLETFLSTTELRGAKVIWGAPPPAAQRDADWALVDWLVTNPETYGNVRVLLANIQNNVAEDVAYRNAVHRSPAELEQEVQAHLRTGHFATIDGPSRPLSPERDLAIRPVDPTDLTLHLADLLDEESEPRYRSLVSSGAHQVEAEEGLAMLAARRNDAAAASDLLRKAMAGGSKNAVAMLAYARTEPDFAKSRAAIESAVSVDPNSAEAHFLFGQKLTDPAKQIQQWTISAQLAPRNQQYWVTLAKALADQKRWNEAAKAWSGAEQAASTPVEREKMMAERLAIEGRRLDYEDGEKRRQEEARDREIKRLKQQAIAEIRAVEAKVNKDNEPAAEARAFPWDQLATTGLQADGQLVRIECTGRAMRLILRTADGKMLKLSANPAKMTLANANGANLACGPQKDRAVSIAYDSKPNARTGVSGDARSIEFR